MKTHVCSVCLDKYFRLLREYWRHIQPAFQFDAISSNPWKYIHGHSNDGQHRQQELPCGERYQMNGQAMIGITWFKSEIDDINALSSIYSRENREGRFWKKRWEHTQGQQQKLIWIATTTDSKSLFTSLCQYLAETKRRLREAKNPSRKSAVASGQQGSPNLLPVAIAAVPVFQTGIAWTRRRSIIRIAFQRI